MTLTTCIDYQSLARGDAKALDSLAEQCANLGCFELGNHGIAFAMLDEVFAQMRAFFHAPPEHKRALSRTHDNPWGYYDRELTKNRVDWKEIYDLGIDITEGPIRSTCMWPPDRPAFKAVMLAYFAACSELSRDLTGHICASLGVARDALTACFAPRHTSFLRLNHYPICPTPAPPDAPSDDPPGHLGIHRHTDAGALTLLACDGVPGLQMRTDRWCDANIDPRHLLVNVGDMLEVWSNGRYRAPEHRVLANARDERFSAPFFYNPSFDTVCAPLPGTHDEQRPPRFRPIVWGEFRLARAAGDYADRGREVQISDFALPA